MNRRTLLELVGFGYLAANFVAACGYRDLTEADKPLSPQKPLPTELAELADRIKGIECVGDNAKFGSQLKPLIAPLLKRAETMHFRRDRSVRAHFPFYKGHLRGVVSAEIEPTNNNLRVLRALMRDIQVLNSVQFSDALAQQVNVLARSRVLGQFDLEKFVPVVDGGNQPIDPLMQNIMVEFFGGPVRYDAEMAQIIRGYCKAMRYEEL